MTLLASLSAGFRPLGRLVLPLLLIAPLAAFTSGERLFAPSADLWERWETHDPASTAQIDFSAWDSFVKRNVVVGSDGVHRLDYAALAASCRAGTGCHHRRPRQSPDQLLCQERAIRLLGQPLQRGDREGDPRPLPGGLDPGCRYLARPLRQWPLGQGACERGRRGADPQRNRASHPAADLARPAGALCGELRVDRLSQSGHRGLHRQRPGGAAGRGGAQLRQRPARA